MAFRKRECSLGCLPNAVTAERPFSLIGAAAVWSGLAKGPDLIREPTVVVRPEAPIDEKKIRILNNVTAPDAVSKYSAP